MKKIFITGALGQIGSELVPYLRKIYGVNNVIASDIKRNDENPVLLEGVFEELNVMDIEKYELLIKKHNIDTVMHMAALLSATAEKDPIFAWNLNMTGLLNSLEICKNNNQ